MTKNKTAHEDEEFGPSKTQLKREMTALQKLGEELVSLTSAQLKKIPLPEKLLDAIQDAQKMTKHRALYRQRQYIGRVMREVDAEPIIAALEEMRHPERLANARFHKVEAWRDKLIAETDANTEFLEEFASVDRQQLGQKVRAARKESQTGKPAGAGRALFRFIDDHLARLAKKQAQ